MKGCFNMIKVEFLKRSEVDDVLLEYAVIATKSNGKWIYVKHRERTTWEIPGGRREKDEPIHKTAERELIEETGAFTYEIMPIGAYSVTTDTAKSYGLLCYAEVEKFSDTLEHEIDEVREFDALPDEMTYPLIQPILMEAAKEFKWFRKK